MSQLWGRTREAADTYKVCVVLEGVVQVGDPPAVSEHKNVSLFLKASCLGSLQHLPFVKNLEGEDLVCVPHLHHTNFPESSAADHFQYFKIFLAQSQ